MVMVVMMMVVVVTLIVDKMEKYDHDHDEPPRRVVWLACNYYVA